MTGMGSLMVRRLHAPKGNSMSPDPSPMLDPTTIRRIARLARIRLDEAEIPRMQTDLNGILAWIEMLNEVNVEGITPLAGGTQIALRLRPDGVTDGGDADQVLANAPDRAGAFFAVPKVVE
jgi:aspartyl-tRNA(Asn)/glutamyl-tRNA(Gln) amidotransferase subunit C